MTQRILFEHDPDQKVVVERVSILVAGAMSLLLAVGFVGAVSSAGPTRQPRMPEVSATANATVAATSTESNQEVAVEGVLVVAGR